MSASPPTFRLRRDGQITGPFPRTQIRLMARRGEIALTDELSLAGGQWVPVSGTPLSAEIPKKAVVTLRKPPAPAERRPNASAFLGQGLQEEPIRANEDLFDTKTVAAFPKVSGGPVRVPTRAAASVPPPARPAPVPAQAEEDPLADWDTGPADVAAAPPRRRTRRRASKGYGLEVFMVLLVIALLVGVILIAFMVGRSRLQPPPVVQSPAPAAPSVPPAMSASAKEFIGNTYDLWYFEKSTVPNVRLRLEANGSIAILQSANPVDEAARFQTTWTLEQGTLILWSSSRAPEQKFPNAQPLQAELMGTYRNAAVRKLTLVGRQ